MQQPLQQQIVLHLMEFQIYDDIHVIFCDSKKNAKWAVLSILKRMNELYNIGRKK